MSRLRDCSEPSSVLSFLNKVVQDACLRVVPHVPLRRGGQARHGGGDQEVLSDGKAMLCPSSICLKNPFLDGRGKSGKARKADHFRVV